MSASYGKMIKVALEYVSQQKQLNFTWVLRIKGKHGKAETVTEVTVVIAFELKEFVINLHVLVP